MRAHFKQTAWHFDVMSRCSPLRGSPLLSCYVSPVFYRSFISDGVQGSNPPPARLSRRPRSTHKGSEKVNLSDTFIVRVSCFYSPVFPPAHGTTALQFFLVSPDVRAPTTVAAAECALRPLGRCTIRRCVL